MRAARPRENRVGLAVVTLLAVFAMFTSMDTIAKWLVLAGLPALQVAFLRYAVHFGAILVTYVPGEGLGILRSNAPWTEVLRGVMLLASTAFNFAALA
ncbi:MAG: EamA/RhaT family transporter, partial [Pseudomonadota bacterium]